jgi:hypothetical protein
VLVVAVMVALLVGVGATGLVYFALLVLATQFTCFASTNTDKGTNILTAGEALTVPITLLLALACLAVCLLY